MFADSGSMTRIKRVGAMALTAGGTAAQMSDHRADKYDRHQHDSGTFSPKCTESMMVFCPFSIFVSLYSPAMITPPTGFVQHPLGAPCENSGHGHADVERAAHGAAHGAGHSGNEQPF
jgi:hypothetical protein